MKSNKQELFVLLICVFIFIAVTVKAITKEDMYDNNQKIIANWVLMNPLPSTLESFWLFINANTRYIVTGKIDSKVDYYYAISVTQLLNGVTIDDITVEVEKTTGKLSGSVSKYVGLDYNDQIFEQAVTEKTTSIEVIQ